MTKSPDVRRASSLPDKPGNDPMHRAWRRARTMKSWPFWFGQRVSLRRYAYALKSKEPPHDPWNVFAGWLKVSKLPPHSAKGPGHEQ